MAVTTGGFNNLWTRKINETFFEAWDEEPEEWSRYLHARTSNEHNETYQSFAGGSAWDQKAEGQNATQQGFNLGDLIVTNHTPFGVEVIMTREMVADSKYNEVEDMARDQGRAGANRVEQNCVTVLDNAFATTAQYDGEFLIDSAHPYRKTGLGGTQTNITTGAASDTTIKAGINLFNGLKDESGKIIKMRPSKIVTHANNQFTIATIFNSVLRSATANNDKNVLPNLEFVFSNFMTSTTAWFLEAKQHKLIHFFREQPTFVKRKYMNPQGSWSWDGYFRDSTAVRNWRGVVGSLGT